MNIFYLQWHITNNCENRCSHCYQEKYDNNHDISVEDAIKILNDVQITCQKLNAKSIVSITGGDPLLHDDFIEILTLAAKKCDQVNIMANPEILLKSFSSLINLLKILQINNWQLSLDGLELTHDKIRYNGSFNNTVRSIKKLVKHNIKVSVLTTISSQNIHDAASVMELVYSLGVYSWDFSRLIPKHADCGISPIRYKKFLLEIIKKHSFYESKGAPPVSKEPLLNLLNDNNSKFSGCGLGSASFCLLPDKTIMACRRLPNSSLGKWSEQKGFIDYFLYNQIVLNYRTPEYYGECKNCDYYNCCRGCRAASLASKGYVAGRDPQCWIHNE